MSPQLFAAERFPIVIEFLHPVTREVVDTVTVEKPEPGKLAEVYIPPVAQLVGHPVAVRVTYGDGKVEETHPMPFHP